MSCCIGSRSNVQQRDGQLLGEMDFFVFFKRLSEVPSAALVMAQEPVDRHEEEANWRASKYLVCLSGEIACPWDLRRLAKMHECPRLTDTSPGRLPRLDWGWDGAGGSSWPPAAATRKHVVSLSIDTAHPPSSSWLPSRANTLHLSYGTQLWVN